MSKKYHEIMDQVTVTDEMRKRILQNMSAGVKKKKGWHLNRRLRIVVAMAACVALVVCGMWIGENWKEQGENKSTQVADKASAAPSDVSSEDESVLGFNESVICKNRKELAKEAGFDVCEPRKLCFTPEKTEYTVPWEGCAQIEYIGKGQKICYRQSKEDADNSGDTTVYQTEKEKTIGDFTVTLKGEGTKVVLAIWKDETYSYSMRVDKAVSSEAMEQMIASTK